MTSTDARATIYLGPELRDRLAAAGDAINCSAVCRRAIQRELATIDSQKTNKRRRDAVKRLREQALLERDETFRRAFMDGVEWAEQDASYTVLNTLHAASEARGSAEWTVDDVLRLLLDPADLRNQSTYDAEAGQWLKRYGKNAVDRAATAWVKGAMSLFVDIRGQLLLEGTGQQ